MLELAEFTEVLLTHQLVPSGPLPTAYDPDGFYPYESFCETSRRPILTKYRMVSIENDQIRVKICPDLGARVCSLLLKKEWVETLYFPHVIRPVRILPRNSFMGGGIELSARNYEHLPTSRRSTVSTMPYLLRATPRVNLTNLRNGSLQEQQLPRSGRGLGNGWCCGGTMTRSCNPC